MFRMLLCLLTNPCDDVGKCVCMVAMAHEGEDNGQITFQKGVHFEHLMCKSKNLDLHDVPEMKREVSITARL